MKYSNMAWLPCTRALPFFFRLGTAPVSRRIPFPEGSEGGVGVSELLQAEPENSSVSCLA